MCDRLRLFHKAPAPLPKFASLVWLHTVYSALESGKDDRKKAPQIGPDGKPKKPGAYSAEEDPELHDISFVADTMYGDAQLSEWVARVCSVWFFSTPRLDNKYGRHVCVKLCQALGAEFDRTLDLKVPILRGKGAHGPFLVKATGILLRSFTTKGFDLDLKYCRILAEKIPLYFGNGPASVLGDCRVIFAELGPKAYEVFLSCAWADLLQNVAVKDPGATKNAYACFVALGADTTKWRLSTG